MGYDLFFCSEVKFPPGETTVNSHRQKKIWYNRKKIIYLQCNHLKPGTGTKPNKLCHEPFRF